jgi:hypothetical protein
METNMKKINNEHGQVAIEFILVFIFAISLSFLFVYLGINYVTGYIAHYTTFMASRTFLVADDGSRDIEAVLSHAEQQSRVKFSRYNLSTFGLSVNGLRLERPAPGKKAIFVGAVYEFQQALSPTRLIGGNDKATFLSESFLGKEPVRKYCFDQICQAMGYGNECVTDMDATLFDNGC